MGSRRRSAFTGSSAVGRKIAAACGASLKRVTLELGGKSAGIVLEDATSTSSRAHRGDARRRSARPVHLIGRGVRRQRNRAEGYIEPAVFSGVRNDMRVAREEIVGPSSS